MVFAQPTAQVIPSIAKLAVCTLAAAIGFLTAGASVVAASGLAVSVSYLQLIITILAIAIAIIVFLLFIGIDLDEFKMYFGSKLIKKTPRYSQNNYNFEPK